MSKVLKRCNERFTILTMAPRKKKTLKITRDDILKADRKGRREAELEIGNRFRPSIQKSDKSYSRKKKHKNNKPPHNKNE